MKQPIHSFLMSPLNFLQILGTTNIARVYSAKIRKGLNKNWRQNAEILQDY